MTPVFVRVKKLSSMACRWLNRRTAQRAHDLVAHGRGEPGLPDAEQRGDDEHGDHRGDDPVERRGGSRRCRRASAGNSASSNARCGEQRRDDAQRRTDEHEDHDDVSAACAERTARRCAAAGAGSWAPRRSRRAVRLVALEMRRLTRLRRPPRTRTGADVRRRACSCIHPTCRLRHAGTGTGTDAVAPVPAVSSGCRDIRPAVTPSSRPPAGRARSSAAGEEHDQRDDDRDERGSGQQCQSWPLVPTSSASRCV